jgi:3,4-dihydroxy 2-butanone 4-phosphate synthase/GTP cyclohydrolase II
MAIHSTAEIIEDIRQGKMVIIMDDEDRENEGDIIMAAEKVTPWHITFMARQACGLICISLSKARCEQIGLAKIQGTNHSKIAPNFTLSIEAAKGVTTGISAKERAHTILTAVHPSAVPSDVVQPGHVFPIMALPGGVLERPGHTEASADLARLAGFSAAGVLCEIMNEDGTMARRPELENFGKQHGLKIGTIADLIEYRLQTEKNTRNLTDLISVKV